MAHFLSQTRNVMQNLKPKMVFLGNSWNASFIHYHTRMKFSDAFQDKKASLFTFWRSESVKAEKELDSMQNLDDSQVLNHPGGRVKFSSNLNFLPESSEDRIHCYRVLDDNGQPTSSNFLQIAEEVAVKMYTNMATLQTMDTIFYEAQRQGRISFYVTTIGEEAINVASAAALHTDDLVFPQYREPGVLLWRGFTLQEFANQCFGNREDNGKGRQMPAHYGSNKHNYFTVASTVATQIPHAVGAAYSLKMDQINACTITYFGDGGTSTGDFHAALNFAAVLGDGVAVRGQAYGVRSIRVDGNDALAIFSAVHAARQMAISEQRPVLIEALTYRAGHHSTWDDSTKYRPADEIEWWRMTRDPVTRFRKWLEREGWWSDQSEKQLRSNLREQVLHALQAAEKLEKATR